MIVKKMSYPKKYLRKEKSSRILTRPALPIGLGTTAAFSALFWILAINSCLAVAEEVAAEEAEVIEGPPPPDSCLRRAPLPPATVGGGPWEVMELSPSVESVDNPRSRIPLPTEAVVESAWLATELSR